MIAAAREIPIISCMGTGNKLDPGKLCLTDLYQTQTCPLARIMRRELRKRKIASLKVVYSTEAPRKPTRDQTQLMEFLDNSRTASQKDSEPLLKQDSSHVLKADTDESGQQTSCSAGMTADEPKKRLGPASIAFVPGSAGLMLAAAVVRDLLQTDTD